MFSSHYIYLKNLKKIILKKKKKWTICRFILKKVAEIKRTNNNNSNIPPPSFRDCVVFFFLHCLSADQFAPSLVERKEWRGREIKEMVETFIFFCCCCVFLRLKNIRNVRALQFTITSGGMVIIITNFFVCLRVPEGLGFFVFFSTLIIFRFASLLFVCSMPPAVYLWRMLYYGINYSLRLYYQTKNICHVFTSFFFFFFFLLPDDIFKVKRIFNSR